MVTKDDDGRTVLMLAAASKNTAVVEGVLETLEEHRCEDEVREEHTCLQEKPIFC